MVFADDRWAAIAKIIACNITARTISRRSATAPKRYGWKVRILNP
jgi:hypothetical protein